MSVTFGHQPPSTFKVMDTGKDEHTLLAFTNVASTRNAAFLGQRSVVVSRCSSSIGIRHGDFENSWPS